jgi:hypothetical protein
MHAYIVVFIGLENGIHTFVPWNAMCVALSALLFGQQHPGGGFIELHHILLLFALHAPPILQIFGKNEYGTLSHSWFVPSASGSCVLLVPPPILSNVPQSENGLPIKRLRDARLRFEAASHIAAVKDDAKLLFGVEADAGSRGARQLVQQCILIDDNWVTSTASAFSLCYSHFDICSSQNSAATNKSSAPLPPPPKPAPKPASSSIGAMMSKVLHFIFLVEFLSRAFRVPLTKKWHSLQLLFLLKWRRPRRSRLSHRPHPRPQLPPQDRHRRKRL